MNWFKLLSHRLKYEENYFPFVVSTFLSKSYIRHTLLWKLLNVIFILLSWQWQKENEVILQIIAKRIWYILTELSGKKIRWKVMLQNMTKWNYKLGQNYFHNQCWQCKSKMNLFCISSLTQLKGMSATFLERRKNR